MMGLGSRPACLLTGDSATLASADGGKEKGLSQSSLSVERLPQGVCLRGQVLDVIWSLVVHSEEFGWDAVEGPNRGSASFLVELD